MNYNVKAAFVAAGAIDAEDCMKLHTVTNADPGEQAAAFKVQHPALFHQPPMPNARTMTPAEFKASLAELARQDYRRRQDITSQRGMESIERRFGAK